MIQTWGRTDTGLVRKENQDAYAIRENVSGGHTVCVVCDGMGGPAGGQMASRIAVDTYLAEVEPLLRSEMSPTEIQKASEQAVQRSNRAIREAAAQDERYAYMGTTLVSAISCPEGVVVTNVGDSRAYYYYQNRLLRITRDHSLVQNMVDRGDIPPEEARRHPKRNLITRALGPDEKVECDGFLCYLETGANLLLCTDGLTNTVRDEEIQEAFHLQELEKIDMEGILDRLFQLALRQGAPDNVTAVLMRWAAEKEAS